MLANFYALHSGTATPYDGRRQLPDDNFNVAGFRCVRKLFEKFFRITPI